jgi:hypothetical protein
MDPLTFRILTEEIEPGAWIAHALEVDLSASASTEQDSLASVAVLLEAHVEKAGNSKFSTHPRPLPSDIWERFGHCHVFDLRLRKKFS